MAISQYPNINENQFAGLLQVATAAADAQERSATAAGKRKRDDEAYIDHSLRTPADDTHHSNDSPGPTLQSSAAVLFREPSEKSKKYSRPPLGKVYTDLELAPEMFLQLQSAAKEFMLDPNHPERLAVVGQKRQNGNNDVAKLKLWNCVEQFLHTPNAKTGELTCDFYFGHGAGVDIPNQPVRTFFWPEDRDQVIKMCMPLFRKMVTNERQRLYASETRKHDGRKSEKDKQDSASNQTDADVLNNVGSNGLYQQDQQAGQDQSNMFLGSNHNVPSTHPILLHVNVVTKDGENSRHRMIPRFSVPATAAQTMSALVGEILKHDVVARRLEPDASPTIKAWLEEGLTPIQNDNEWLGALLTVETVDWMDGELRILVEV